MEKLQMNKLAMYRDTHALLTSTPEVTMIPAMGPKITALASKLGELTELAATQSEPLTGKIAAREQLFDDAITAALTVAGPALSYANARGLHDLSNRLRLSRNDFTAMRIEVRMLLAQQVHDALVPLLVGLADHGVTSDMLAGLQTKIDAATDSIRVPRNANVSRVAATRRLAAVVGDIDALLENEIDPLVRPLRQADADFDARYETARRIEDRPGVRSATATNASVTAPAAAPATTQPAKLAA